MILSFLPLRIWYFVEYVVALSKKKPPDAESSSCCSGRRHYHGPHVYVTKNVAPAVDEGEGETDTVDSKDEGRTT